MMDLVADALFCILYLVEVQYLVSFLMKNDSSSYPDPSWLFVPRPRAIWIIAMTMSSWNIMSAVIRFIFADSKLGYIFSLQTLLDAMTALPFMIAASFLPDGQFLYVPYFLRSWSVISRLERALSIGVEIGISNRPFDPVKAKLIGLLAYFLAILYNATCAFMYCELNFAPGVTTLTILDAFYYIMITVSTVGYGDITPKSIPSKAVVMVLIIVAIAILPGIIAGTVDTIKSTRAGGGSYSQRWNRDGTKKPYIVLIGSFQNARRVHDMMSWLFNKEFSGGDIRLVFLSRSTPSKDVTTLLTMPMFKSKVTMLVGNGLDEDDLKRCQVKDAKGVFIIPEKYSSVRETEDTMTTLQAWSIHLHAPKTPIYTYNLLPETESFQWDIVEKSVCIPDIKQLLLAYNCRHQGVGTLILNLLLPSEPSDSYEYGWQAQYGDSSGNEIYMAAVPKVFVGWTFAQVAWFVFQEFQTILIGVDIRLTDDALKGARGFNEKTSPHSSVPPHVSTSSTRQKYERVRTSPGVTDHAYSANNRRNPPFTRSGLGDGTHSYNASPANHASALNGQYHLTLNPGNNYRLGSKDRLVFIAQSPCDINDICRFTVEQYERLAKDERGFYQEASHDFSMALERYFSIHSARVNSRVVAQQRAEGMASIQVVKEKPQCEATTGSSYSETVTDMKIPTSEERHILPPRSRGNPVSEAVGESPGRFVAEKSSRVSHLQYHEEGSAGRCHVSSTQEPQVSSFRVRSASHSRQRLPSINVQCSDGSGDLHACVSYKATTSEGSSRKARPAWNVALYGRGDESDSSSSRNDSANESDIEHLYVPSMGGIRGESRREFEEQEVLHAQQEESLSDVNDAERTHPGALYEQGKHNTASKRNAATMAAMADGNISTTSTSSSFFMPDVDTSHNSVSNEDSASPATASTIPSPTANRFSMAGQRRKCSKVHQSFKSLDEMTYIGQPAITRADTQDLPLCHLLISPPKSIRSQIRLDLSRLKNHVLVCSPPGEDLYRFIATLRLASIGKEDLKPIVVLTKNPLETFMCSLGEDSQGKDDEPYGTGVYDSDGESHWDAILAFPHVYWVSGNCRHQRDLVRAGLLGADRIVVMSHTKEDQGDEDEFADSVAIMANHMIYQTLYQRGLLGRQSIVVELKESSNTRFLSMRPDLTGFVANSQAEPVKGHSLLKNRRRRRNSIKLGKDSIMPTNATGVAASAGPSAVPSSATDQHFSSQLPRRTVGRGEKDTSMHSSQFIMSPVYASGQVLIGSLLDNVLFQAYTKKHIIDLIKLCCGVRLKHAIELDQLLGIDCSHVCLMEIPPHFVGKPFLRMFQELTLVHGMVPLGLFRAPNQQLGNILPFVFTNPLAGILLKPDDKIYVLQP
ncbi:potassium channel, sub T, member 1 [Actinomortierella wolfii]|nr:potassium channel, sub T, member 1 [Actinomortierella wolfii]